MGQRLNTHNQPAPPPPPDDPPTLLSHPYTPSCEKPAGCTAPPTTTTITTTRTTTTFSSSSYSSSRSSTGRASRPLRLCAASTFKSVLHHYRQLCDVLKLKPTNICNFYPKLKSRLRSWKAQALWNKFDKRAAHRCYNHGKACQDCKVLIIGAGPCGLRSAIEAQLLGAKVVVVEKRDRFSRNNFYGKFCAGAIDHISIRQLQCILLKVALLLGVEVFETVSFEELVEPPSNQEEKIGWRARLSPPDHPANQFEFDCLFGADGKRNTLPGFRRKEFRGKLAIAITANFINRRSEAEARVQEISGVAFIFNQKFFKELYAATGIDLENIVYYKDETHYFVMTAKKQSLIDKGVILNDVPDTQELLHSSNVDRTALLEYAREAADFSTNYQLPHLDFAVNHYGKPDVAMFDFTSMFAAENACRMWERNGHKLLTGLVGDTLLEPFWPTGSGCARGFLGCFDAAWMLRSWAAGKMSPLEVLAERESVYRLLAQTTPENLSKDHVSYMLDPSSRYPTINLRAVLPFQVRNLFDTDDPAHLEEVANPHLANTDDMPKKRKRRDSFIHPDTLLVWCKKQVALYDSVKVDDMAGSFKDGRVLCAIIHRYRPDLIDFDALRPEDIAQNNQLAYDILERDFGIPPVMTGAEMAEIEVPDKLTMISYLSQIYDVFRGEIPHFKYPKMDVGEMEVEDGATQRSTTRHVNILKNLTNKTASVAQAALSARKRLSQERAGAKSDGRLTCRVIEDGGSVATGERKGDTLKKTKKRRSDRVTSPLDRSLEEGVTRKTHQDQSGDFNEKVKDLEAKFTSRGNTNASDRKPKDLLRAIGKIEKSDWNVAAIEKKMHENKFGLEVSAGKEKVPMWSRDNYDDKFHNIERRLRENGEDEETIAKYRDIDSSLKRLEMKLREGSTLETGLRGKNKVSNLASQLSSKLEKKEPEKVLVMKQQSSRPMVPLPSSGSDLCHFCGNRVYLVERLSAEGKFFHRQCFKCDYCAANLRLGNYIYDREGRYGGKFFCIPHFGLAPRAKGLRYRGEDTDSAKENIVPTTTAAATTTATATPIQLQVPTLVAGEAGGKAGTGTGPGTPTIAGLTPEDRGTTPERVEFENSLVEQSDEEEYLSEDEWTDRNFGASANELDESDGEDSDYSDLSDEEVEDEEMEFLEGGGKLTAAETRRLAESWQRRYSTDNLDDCDSPHSGKESESDLDSDNYSEECGAEGDESHTATEGEGGEDDDEEEEEGEAVKRARELRRLEVNIDVTAPPRKAETSDSGSDTEVASDEESEESDTQIDTDSEFADDHVQPGPPKSIPTIVINETHDPRQESPAPEDKAGEETRGEAKGEPRANFVSQRIDLGQKEDEDNWVKENGEKSASLTNLNETGQANPRAEQLKRLLQRTDSTEAIAAQRALQLKRQYLLGENSNLPRKSVSTADLGNRFKSFMDKISETQKMLNPAPQPSAAMQAFMSTSVSSLRSPSSSPSSPQLTARSISLPQGDDAAHTNNATTTSSSTTTERPEAPVTPSPHGQEGREGQKGELKGFPSPSKPPQGEEEATQAPEECLGKIPLSESSSGSSESSSSSSSSSSGDGSDYDNVPTGSKWSPPKKSPTAIELQQHPSTGVTDSAFSDGDVRTSDTTTDLLASTQPPPDSDARSSQEAWVIGEPEGRGKDSDDDNVFGLSLPGDTDAGVETVNRELVLVNAPRSLEGPCTGEAVTLQEEEEKKEEGTKKPVLSLVDDLERENEEDNVDELFNKLASDAVEDIDKFSELVESSTANYNGFPFCDDPSPKETEAVIACDSERKTDAASVTVCVAGVVESARDDQHVENVKDAVTLASESNLAVIRDSSREGKEAEVGREAGVSPKSDQPSPLTPSPSEELLPPPTKESLSSPEEGREYTETELSDWAGDNGGVSAGEDLEVEVNERDRPSHRASLRGIARIASEESLGDTDSAISSGQNVTTSAPAKPPTTLADLDGIEFMDTSESASSPEELTHQKQGYQKLEEETPTTPLAPQISLIGQAGPTTHASHSSSSSSSSSQSDSTSTELDTSQSSVQEAPSAAQQTEGSPAPPPKSMSEPPSLSEPRARMNGERRHDSLEECTSPRRYEGYIPRFKERMSPFGYVRDSIDMQKSSSRTSLASPRTLDGQREDHQEDEEEEEEEQRPCLSAESSPARSNPKVSPNTAKKQIESSLKSRDRDKEKDLIKEMVMSRITRRSSEKTPRRTSRTSPSPLSSTSSRTSLFSPQSSQENLLEKQGSTTTTPSTTPSTATEAPAEECGKRHIHVDSPTLLRLDTVQQELPDGGQTFGAEENRAKIRVGNFFRDDSVLGGPGRSGSLHDVNVPFVDESQDEDASERREASCRSTPSASRRSPATKRASMLDAAPRPKLPATPLTHPEQFSNPPVKFPGPPSSPPPSLNSLASVSAPNTPRGSATAPGSASYTPRSTLAPRGSPATPKATTTPVPTSVTPVPIRPHRASAHAKGLPSPSERPLSTPNLGTVERERAREEARGRAKLKTDHDLGLSPPCLADNLREKLKKGGAGEAEAEAPLATPRASKAGEGAPATAARDKEERVRELLEEQRQHRQREAPDAVEEPASKEDRLRERLEEYRQRQRGGSTRNSTTAAASSSGNSGGDGRPKSQLLRRHTHHRPSLLELESLQVFTASLGPTPPQQPYSVPPSPAPSSTTTASSTTSTPASQPSQDSPSDKKPSGKKSKDRERRRSLIQVFTGMFSSKSDDKKKADHHSEASDAHSTTTTATTVASAPPTPPLCPLLQPPPRRPPRQPP
ncbi:hypothetical protein O3P69_009264 [Scylla paramamosain]|uniref:F-actin monooxygenase n=1 Tax=Scylla paramamosain TaxID=85552 RepID=A0AAW0T9T9_SCYPA